MSNLSSQVMKCQRRKKMDVVERFGGKCQVCGYDKCINALEFHHLEDKKESPSYVIMRWSWKRAKKELEKCIMVCANCHREIHYKIREIDPENLSITKWLTHTCPTCFKGYDTRNKDQIFCSQVCSKRYHSKPGRPSKEELRHLIRTHPQRQVAVMLNVCQSTVRQWCVNYGIEIGVEGCRSLGHPDIVARREERLNRPQGKRSIRKLSLEQARAAMRDIQRGEESLRVIAARYGVHHSILIGIQRGRSYTELKSEFPDWIKEATGRQRPCAKTTIRSLKKINTLVI